MSFRKLKDTDPARFGVLVAQVQAQVLVQVHQVSLEAAWWVLWIPRVDILYTSFI